MYKVILMDINMPGIDGVETVKRLRKLYPHEMSQVFVVAYTAIPKDQFGNLQEKKFDGYLPKPSAVSEIKEILQRAKLL